MSKPKFTRKFKSFEELSNAVTFIKYEDCPSVATLIWYASKRVSELQRQQTKEWMLKHFNR